MKFLKTAQTAALFIIAAQTGCLSETEQKRIDDQFAQENRKKAKEDNYAKTASISSDTAFLLDKLSYQNVVFVSQGSDCIGGIERGSGVQFNYMMEDKNGDHLSACFNHTYWERGSPNDKVAYPKGALNGVAKVGAHNTDTVKGDITVRKGLIPRP